MMKHRSLNLKEEEEDRKISYHLSRGLIDCYFSGRYNQQLVKHQIDSYNDFVSRKLEQIIEGFNTIDVCNSYLPEHGCFRYILSLTLKNPMLSRPTILEKDGSTKAMLPNDARLRNLTYAAPLTVDVHITAKTFAGSSGEIGTADGGRGTGDKMYVSETKRILSVNLGRIPVMVRSRFCMLSNPNYVSNGMDECRYDYGGYFIINGSEKVVVSQDRIAENRTYVFLNNKATCYSHVAEIRSVQESRFGVPKTLTLKLASKPNQFGRSIKISIHHIQHDVPITILFRALGVESDKDIARMIVRGSWGGNEEEGSHHERLLVEQLAASFDEGSSIRTVQAAQDYLAVHLAASNHHYNAGALAGSGTHKDGTASSPSKEQRLGALRSVLRKDLLPHVGTDFLKKALYVGHMTARLLECFLGIRQLDDRDSFVNKRLDTPGVLMANLFRQYYGKTVKDMRTLVQKDINNGNWKASNKFINVVGKSNIYKLIKATTIEQGLKSCLSTGNWGPKNKRQGVAQVLNRLTYVASLSHLRRVNTPIEKTGKLVQPRKLHASQWGMVCPSETPEGASVGLVKNLALLANITVSSPSDPIHSFLEELGLAKFDGSLPPDEAVSIFGGGAVRVYVNGDLVGSHGDPSRLCTELRQCKRRGGINVFTSISWAVTAKEIHLCTDGGRFVRPLLVVQNGRLVLDSLEDLKEKAMEGKAVWHDLVLSGAIEYLDGDEVEGSVIAMTLVDLVRGEKNFTHMEVSPSAMLGVVAGSIPYSDHNQAPRNTYQSAMGKQAIGIYASNYRHRFDTLAHVLNYPQKPMVSTHTARIMNCDNLPCGINTIVAIACFTGFNQEDSVIVNKSAIDRGLFVSTFYRTFREQNNKNHSTGEEEFFCRPDPAVTRNMKSHNYDKVGPNGFVDENTPVEGGDVIVGKCMPQKQGHTVTNKDTSVALKNNERGFIDRNCYGNRHFTNVTGDGYTFAKVRIRQERVPTIGDKVSSRHGQKGTIGMRYREEDMPFTSDGIIPSLIMNPHAIPSRMTIGQLMEAIESKAGALSGRLGDATPFNGRTVEDIADELEALGAHRYGDEVMYNPRTGEQVPCAIFVCPTYYQRLKHMVEDKVHCLTEDHDVLTTRGWVPIAEVTIEDHVATLKDEKLVYDKPIEVMHFPEYSGKMYRIKNQAVDLNVTADHRMLVGRIVGKKKEWTPYSLMKAEDIHGKMVRYKKDAEWDAEDYQFILPAIDSEFSREREPKTFDMDAWLTYFGIWVAEGTRRAIPSLREGTTERYRVQVCQCEKRVRDVIIIAIQKLGYNFHATDEEITITCKQLYMYLSTLGVGTHEKRLPEWVWKLSKQQAQLLADSMILGDGTSRDNSVSYYTSSVGLADDFTRLCLHAGWSATKYIHIPKGQITYIKGREIENKHDIWRLRVIKTRNQPTVNHGDVCTQDIQEESMYEYDGPVYCLSVPSEVFYVRRNGKPVWTGNSRASNGPVVLMTRQPAEGRARDGGLRIGEMEVEAIWAHGMIHFLKERFMETSDNYRMFVCTKCGMFATVNPENNIYSCKACKNVTEFAEIRTPYAMKLLLQEIQTMSIGARFIVDGTVQKTIKNA